MEAIGRQVSRREAYCLYVTVFHFGAHRNVVRSDYDIHTWRGVAAATRLQGAVDSETHHCAQDEGHKANHQKPGAIHELFLKVENAAPVRDTMTRNRDGRRRTPNSDFLLGEVTNRFAGADPTPE